MHERYEKEKIKAIWINENKLALWQETELAVIKANCNLGKFPAEVFIKMNQFLTQAPIDISWWKKRDVEIRHDLNAFLEERIRFISPDLQQYWHKNITSYDTEEPAFAKMLKMSVDIVGDSCDKLLATLFELAKKYRYTIMNARTHGMEAKLQSLGKRCLTWLKELWIGYGNLQTASKNLNYSKLSGAIGNYGGLDPEMEKEALVILGFMPFLGATQIMPRILYAPLAEALCQIVQTLDKIATDIRLGARSGRPIFQEPFGKTQKGSSAMPHKKNTISTEQLEGMARMAKGYLIMIMDNIKTWEERAIEQSCVERVAWPDLFHVTVHSLENMNKVLSGLVVFPDNMLQEIVESRGCYASDEAKELLKELGAPFGLTSEEAYRIIQLAAFNAFEISENRQIFRAAIAESLEEADRFLTGFKLLRASDPREFACQPTVTLETIIASGLLSTSPQLEASAETVEQWNKILSQIFNDPGNLRRWQEIFQPSFLLKNEAKLYKEILGK
ncbi:MAG: lyase family protein [bacterium]|nr:lyase family protein [bacterium]